MRRLLMICFAFLCVSPCGNAEEKTSGSPAHGDSIADRLLAVERRLAALESRPAQQPPPPYVVVQHPPLYPQVVAGPRGNVQTAATTAPPVIMGVPLSQGAVGAVVPQPNAGAAPFLEYKVVSAKEMGGEVVVAMPLGVYRDDAGSPGDELKGELVIDGKDVRVIDAVGKTVDKKNALIRLAKRAIVGVVVLNQPIEIDESSPPKFLKDIPEDTMVILIPEQKTAALWTRACCP